jgi:hypothetical protein
MHFVFLWCRRGFDDRLIGRQWLIANREDECLHARQEQQEQFGVCQRLAETLSLAQAEGVLLLLTSPIVPLL